MQGSHAAIQFQHEHPEIAKDWYENSNYLVFLVVKNEMELDKITYKFKQRNLIVSEFREPDIDNQLTAIAVEPGELTRKLTSKLKLMLNKKQ